MKPHRIAMLALPLLLAACAVGRPPAGVAAPLPPAWHAPLPHGGSVGDLARWWQRMNDPVLSELIAASQRVSPDLASARARIEEARAGRAAATAALLPSLDGVGSVVRSYTQPPQPPTSVAQLGLQSAWELDLFGGNRAAVDAAQARLAGAQAGWHEARVAVAAETALSYLRLRACERQLLVAENDARSRAETARLSQLSQDAGFTAPATAALARASAAEGAARVRQQRAECEVELKSLVAVTAIEEPALRRSLAGALYDVPPDGLFTIGAIPAQMLAQRPDVRRAELDVAAASAEVGQADAARYPRLSLSGSIAAGQVRLNGGDSTAKTWSVGPLALSVPLFDAGRRAADVVAARGRYDAAVVTYQARVRQAVSEVEQALVTLDSAQGRTGDAQTAAEGYRVSFVATEARYRGGLASLVELEDARRTLLAAQTALVSLERERAAAWVTLYRAAGGGWQADTADTPDTVAARP
jgi:NodT family efflux transporter outer membrane factor (OMF) lipoprotein